MSNIPEKQNRAGDAEDPRDGDHEDIAGEPEAERGAESYGGDTDSGPSVTEEEVKRGLDRDQAEG